MSDHDHDNHQVAQDIDAARQMSRARAESIEARSGQMTSPRLIPGTGLSNGDTASRSPANDFTASPSALRGQPRSMASHGGPAPSSSHSARSPLAARNSAQRFYMQTQQHGSNTSLDSASHFIDHRSQPHSVGAHGRVGPAARQSGRPSRGAVDELAVADELLDSHVDDHSFRRRQASSRGGVDAGRRDSHDGETAHTASRRPSALEDDVCFPLAARSSPQQSQQMTHHPHDEYVPAYPDDARDYEDAHHHHDDHDDHDHDMHNNAPPGFPWTFDIKALEEYAEEERDRITATTGDAYGSGLRYRGTESAGRNGGLKEPFNGSGAPYGLSPTSDDATFWSRRPQKHQVAGTASSARPTAPADEAGNAAERLSGPAQKQGRYQRKLALFESGGTAPPPQPDIFGSRAANANTPLLAGGENKAASMSAGLPQYHPSRSEGDRDDYGAKSKMNRSYSQPPNAFPGRRQRKGAGFATGYTLGAGGLSAPTPADKPYRFTFYSNALPSTIHARHLAELPASGQSFEELFLGLAPGALSTTENAERAEGVQQQSASESGSKERATPVMTEDGAKKPDPSQTSALSAQLAARGASGVLAPGRKEGTTAPPSRAHTPVPPVTGSARNSQAGLAVTRTSTINTTGPTPAAAAAAARTMPGGGLRMDQDPEANTWWLDILSPTDQEMKLLSRVFGIHPLTTEDILMEETREKIELFRNYYLVCFRSFDQDPYSPTYLEPLNMYIIVFREGTLSFHFRATPHPQNVRRRIKQLKDYINVTSDWISYALIDDITDAFGPLIQSIEYEVDSIDELVLILKDVEQSDMLRRIGACRKKVMGLLRLMGNKADVVKGLAKRCNENWSVAPKSDIGLYLSDIQDHLITMTQNLSHFEKILSRSHSNYLAQISIEMTEANNRANDVLSKLTALGTVIVPLNVITGLWGMNVHVPGQDIENLHWFGGLVAFMILIAVSGYWVAIRYLRAD
ncbi:unnamed protein product [Parajaminaea phylloscopi]